MTWRIHVEPFTRPLFFVWSRLTRGKTLGVRAVAVDAQGRVLMVRHTYLKGWWLPVSYTHLTLPTTPYV